MDHKLGLVCEIRQTCAEAYVFISTQTGRVLTDSALTQVEGDSRMKSTVGEAGRKGAIETGATG